MIALNQISVFLENRSGKLTQALESLAQAGIQILSLNVSDTTGYGILRMVVSNPEKAVKALTDNQFFANTNNVIAFEIGAAAGEINDIIKVFAVNDLNVNYAYSFSCGKKIILVICTENNDKAFSIIAQNGLKPIGEDDIKEAACLA